MMYPEWWQWAIAGFALILAELVVPAFVLIWFGLGGLVLALMLVIAPSLSITAQLSVWLALSLAFVALWFKVFKANFHKTRVGMSDSNVLGELGMLTRDVAPFQKGEVRFQKPILGADVWPCISDETIAVGTRVKLLAVEGSFLKVGKA